ncbi:MAG: RHS repeat-associated core domain-containing protein, partial [Nitrospira sp.]|nr:RHS repeat-associated core domain-containing protein [Nitrospira sp.]
YDGLNPVQEKSGSTVTANLLTGLGIDEFFTRTDGAGARALLTDALGSTVALGDGTGSLVTQYTYEPFGYTTESGASSTNSFKYTGREDDGSGLLYYRARYYHPRLQRFIAEDPTGLSSGMNLYEYVSNNPISFTDPLGLFTTAAGVPTNERLRAFFYCMDECTGVNTYVTATIEKGHDDWGHMAGTSADIRPTGAPSKKVLCCAKKCGARYALDERFRKTRKGNGWHYHLQLEARRDDSRDIGDLPATGTEGDPDSPCPYC